MLCSLGAVLLALRAGLEMRRRRSRGQPPGRDLIARHVRLARPAVTAIGVGLLGGPISSFLIRDWTPFATLHAWLGLLAGALFIAAGWIGLQLASGRSRQVDAHGWLGLLATLAAAMASFAGFVLLP